MIGWLRTLVGTTNEFGMVKHRVDYFVHTFQYCDTCVSFVEKSRVYRFGFGFMMGLLLSGCAWQCEPQLALNSHWDRSEPIEKAIECVGVQCVRSF